MHRIPKFGSASIVVLAAIASGGCLERNERIKVQRDGGVEMTLRYRGSADDFKTADALPTEPGGWAVVRSIEKGDKEDKHLLSATRRFSAGQTLPATYAAAGDPDAPLYLKFPTEVRIEQRPDGTYYHFKRIYEPRPWAYVHYWQERFIGEDIKKLGQKPQDQLTREDRVKILRALIAVSASEQIEFAAQAIRDCGQQLPQDTWLAARRAMADVYDSIDEQKLAAIHEAGGDSAQQEALAREADDLTARGAKAFEAVLAGEGGWSEPMISRFRIACDRARRYKLVTDQLGSQGFEVVVEMPGEIVATNADELAEGVCTWQFGGDAVRDRSHELMVTSRVKRAADGKTGN